jgi:hypothetical protein
MYEKRAAVIRVAWEHAKQLEISPIQIYSIFNNKYFKTTEGHTMCFGMRSTASLVSDICSDSKDPFHYLEYYLSEDIHFAEWKKNVLLIIVGLTQE